MTTSMGSPQHPGGEPDLDALAALADDQLDEASRVQLLEHLAVCDQCRSILGALVRGKRRVPARAWSVGALSLAATIAVAVAGSGLYVILRDSPSVAHIAQPASTSGAATAASLPPGDAAPPATRRDESTSSAPQTSSAAPHDRTRGVGMRRVHSRTFRLIAGEWVDTAYRVSDGLPVVAIDSQTAFDAVPALKPFAALGPRVTVVIDGTVYRVAVAPQD